ncbi:entry exclusion lipoprotein TrbK [Pseudoxanthomonas sp. UTMC 1351]|uniref:entry exclusion lipoprotein TrbK n=1 Tax=Pseudoxanthomonas sp. UTMC 1351 TaxID=2695853 RepID=UPI0034CDA08B
MKGAYSILAVLGVVLLVAGCSRETPTPETLPAAAPQVSAEEVEELARDSERLEEVRRLCREDRDQVSEALCVASAQAMRKRFMGESKAKYTPEAVALPEAQPPATKDE